MRIKFQQVILYLERIIGFIRLNKNCISWKFTCGLNLITLDDIVLILLNAIKAHNYFCFQNC